MQLIVLLAQLPAKCEHKPSLENDTIALGPQLDFYFLKNIYISIQKQKQNKQTKQAH